MTSTGVGLGDPGQRVDVVGRGGPRVLDGPALDGLAPQVVVDGVQLVLGHRDGDLPLGRQLDAVLAAEAPHPGRRVDGEVGGQRAGPHLEAHLVVPLAGAAVGHGGGAVAAGLGHQVAHDDRARQGGDQRVLALVAGVGLQGGHAELLGHLGAGVDHHGLDRAGGQGPGADGIPVLAAALGRLAHVDGHGDDLDALVLDQPADGHRRIEPTAVGQHHSLSHGQSLPSHVSIVVLAARCRPRRPAAPPSPSHLAPRRRPRAPCRPRPPCRRPRPTRSDRAPSLRHGPIRAACAAPPGCPSTPPRPPTPPAPGADGPRGRSGAPGSSGRA